MYIMEVGKVIKIKRIEKDLKVKELASKVEITEQYMSNIEHGKRNPSLKLLKKLAKELGCSVYEFIEEQGGVISMILELLVLIFAYLFVFVGITSLVFIACSIIDFIIKVFKKQDKGMIEDEQRFQRNMDTKGDMAK